MKEIYIGNIAFDVNEADLNEVFSKFDVIEETKLITDRETGKSKGFAFIKFATTEGADKAIKGADGMELKGRNLRVSFSRPKTKGGSGGNGGGGFGGRRSGGGNGGGGFGGGRGGDRGDRGGRGGY